MDSSIFSKFNLYDQFGYLMVGAVATILFVINALYFYQVAIPGLTVENVLLWLVVTYFVGHMIQGVSNLLTDLPLVGRFFREPKHVFTELEKESLDEVRHFFSVDKADDNKTWNLCYMYASAKDLTGQVQAFNAYYSLYRGWSVIFLFESIFLLFLVWRAPHMENWIFVLLSIFVVIVFYRRKIRFWNYLRSKTFDTFSLLTHIKA